MTPRALALLTGLALLSTTGPACALDAGAIVTEAPDGTAVRFAQDIAGLVRRFGVALEVVPSAGELATMETLTRRPDTQLGIVPSDVLDFISIFSEDPELRSMAALMLVLPLYREEVHVLTRPEIRKLEDLKGRRVAVGAPDSGTLLTTTLLLGTVGIQPAEEMRIGGEEALAALRQGRIDAMIHVASKPGAVLTKVAIEDALHLVPVDHPALRELYPAATIPGGTYPPWQRKEVPTVAPRALLMTLPWTAEPGHQEEACRLVGKIARIVVDNLDRLRREGDPNWREVDPGADVAKAGWQRSPCVERALAGPEGYVLGTDDAAVSPSSPSAAEAAPPETSGRAAGPPRRDCAAETTPLLRQLCGVRPLLRTEP